MLRKVTMTIFVCLLAITTAFATDGFERVAEIPIPQANLNDGGIGNMIAGVDVDEDGMKEIYLINDNTYDGATEVIPRIYKLEFNGASWDSVWSAVAPVAYQNTWPALKLDDLDGDGKHEIIWGPVNSTGEESNPYRVLVYETPGDGSDVMGVDDGDGGYAPNAKWTITADDDVNLRPTKFVISDVDNDDVKEIVFNDRKGQDSGYFFGVASVDNIPDNGDGSETWTLEVSGQDFELGTLYNKWDVAVIGNNCYFPCEWQIAKLSWTGSEWTYDSLPPLAGGVSFNSFQTCDVNSDGQKEIIASEYAWGGYGPYGVDTTRIVLVEEDGDGLKHTPLFPMEAQRLIGGATGDIDQDGNMDFIFGSRYSTPNASIYRVEYNGGTDADIADPENWALSYADSSYMTFDNSGFGVDGIWNVISIANIDDDANLEVLYTSSTGVSAGLGQNMSPPVVVLDYTAGGGGEMDNLVVAEEVVFDGDRPEDLITKPGRILDGGNVIWFMAVDGTNKETWVFRSNDGGETFTHNSTALSGRGAQVDAFDASTALVSCANGKVYKTTDGGATWAEAYSYSLGLGDGWFDGLRVLNSTTAIAYGDGVENGDMHFVKTTDMGETWAEIEGIDYLNSVWGYYTWGAAACNVGESVWMTGYNGNDEAFVFRSYDAGDSWESFAVDTAVTDRIRAIAMINDNDGLATVDDGSVIKTADGGETWETVTVPENAGFVNGVAAVPNSDYIYLFDDGGVFLTGDVGASYTQITVPEDVNENDYFTAGVFDEKEFGYVFTYYGDVLRFENQKPTAIDDDKQMKVAEKYILNQNYPNPFNPNTTISFNLPKANDIKIIIYDIRGNKVTTLVNSKLNPGYHKIDWNGKDANGRIVSAGVYLYQMITPTMTKTKKMTFIK